MKGLKFVVYGLVLMVILILGYMKIMEKNSSELALDIFAWIKAVRGNNVSLDDIRSEDSIIIDHAIWSALLKEHVDSDGKVNYAGIKNDSSKLDAYLDLLVNHPPAKDQPQDIKLAYWINAYNAFTVKLIVDHYPISSIKDISAGLPMINSPWDIKFFRIGGVAFDLNTIEHDILRKQFSEHRIHFAINCASLSCPKLRNEAFVPYRLEEQLQDQAFNFIKNVDKNQISDTEIKISKIFNWFEGDFTKKGTLHAYLREFNSTIVDENNISYLPYNWSLNDNGKLN